MNCTCFIAILHFASAKVKLLYVFYSKTKLTEQVLYEMHVFYSQNVEFKGLVVVHSMAEAQHAKMKRAPG